MIVSRPKIRSLIVLKAILGSPQPDVRACDFGVAVQPLAFPLGLAIEELEALDRPDAFNEI